jgi:hypothetical protein
MNTTLKNLHRFASTWVAGAVAAVAVLEPLWPELSKALPPGWAAYGAALFLVVRAIPQPKLKARIAGQEAVAATEAPQ